MFPPLFYIPTFKDRMTEIGGEIIIVLSAIVIPTIPAIVIISVVVAVDFFFGMWRTIKVDLENRRLIKAKKIEEKDIQENMISSQIGRTASKLLGFSALCLFAGAIQLIVEKFDYHIPFIVATILYLAIHEAKSIDENFKGIFGWGVYTGILKLLNREPLVIQRGKNKITIEREEDKNEHEG